MFHLPFSYDKIVVLVRRADSSLYVLRRLALLATLAHTAHYSGMDRVQIEHSKRSENVLTVHDSTIDC